MCIQGVKRDVWYTYTFLNDYHNQPTKHTNDFTHLPLVPVVRTPDVYSLGSGELAQS